MKLLGFDTSTDACTAGLLVGDEIAVRHQVQARAHTRDLLPMIQALLAEAGLDVAGLDAIVLGNGPGSFIGMRIGASVAQGMAFAGDLPLVAVSSLEAVAAEVLDRTTHDHVLVAQDARMNEVYLAGFDRDGKLPVAAGETVLHRADTPIGRAGRFAAAGAGWRRYPALGGSLPDTASDCADTAFPHARYLLACGRRDAEAGRGIEPDRLEPAYVRHTVAAVPAP